MWQILPPHAEDSTRRAKCLPHVLPGVFAVDLHAHTRFFHAFPGEPTPFDPVGARLLGALARRRGLDAVALTNHDYYEPYDPDGVLALPGVEISTTRGHVLAVGPDPPSRTGPGALSPREAVVIARERGCAAVLPHPYRRGSVRETDARFDAVELNGKHVDTHDRARDLAARRDLPLVGGSDAHYPFEVGRAYTRVDADELTAESLVAAVREERVEPVVAGRRLDRALEPIYRLIHRRKGYR